MSRSLALSLSLSLSLSLALALWLTLSLFLSPSSRPSKSSVLMNVVSFDEVLITSSPSTKQYFLYKFPWECLPCARFRSKAFCSRSRALDRPVKRSSSSWHVADRSFHHACSKHTRSSTAGIIRHMSLSDSFFFLFYQPSLIIHFSEILKVTPLVVWSSHH